MIKNITALCIWLYFSSSSLIINPGPLLSKPKVSSEPDGTALVAAGQGCGRPAAPAAQAVAQPTASLSYIKWLRREWNPYKFNAWFDNPKWSFCALGPNGSRREFTSLSCSPVGNYVVAGERTTWPLPVFKIDRITGILKSVNGPYEYKATGFDVVAYSPDSKRVAALRRNTGFSNPCLALFDVDAASGKLTPTKDFKLVVDNFSPSSHIAYSPNGKWLVLSNNEPDSILPDGQWAKRSFEGGKFLTLFAVDQESGALVERFAMTERGYIHALIGYLNPRRYMYTDQYKSVGPYTDTRTKTGLIRFSPDSNWLITTENLRSRINVFKVDTNTGRLTLASEIHFKDSGDVAFSPDGQYVVISSCVCEHNFALFHFDSNTGELKPIADSPFKTGDWGASAIAFSPGGNRIAVVHHLDNHPRPENSLTVFTFDGTLQKLTPVPGSPFAAPKDGSKSVCYSPNGELLFVGSARSDKIWVYEVDEFTGSLDFITGEPLLKVQKKYDYAVRMLEQNNYIIPAVAKFVRAYCYKETVVPKKATQEH